MSILHDHVQKVCPVCQKEYMADVGRLKHGRQGTCSKECSYKLRSNKKSKKVYLDCANCGNPVERSPSAVRSKYDSVFCSRQCHYEGRSKGLSGRKVIKPYDIKPVEKQRVNVACVNCGINIEIIPSLKDRKRFCSKKCQNTYAQITMKGENNHAWIDGRSREKRCYRGDSWQEQRNSAYKRDNYTCQMCGVKCVSRRAMNEDNSHKLIQCHHIVEWDDSHDNSLENLVTLCVCCHQKVHNGHELYLHKGLDSQSQDAKIGKVEKSQQLSLFDN